MDSSERRHPSDLSQPELAELLRSLSGLLYHLRDFIAQALELEGEAREQAFADACQQAYDVVYVEHVPPDALAVRGVEGYELPDFSDRPAEELRELVWATSWLALDLAQHLSFATQYMAPEFRSEAYARALPLAGELADFPVADIRSAPLSPGIAAIGEGGLAGWTR